MSSMTEIEHITALDCTYTSGTIVVSGDDNIGWRLKKENDNEQQEQDGQQQELLPCTYLNDKYVIKILPMNNQFGGWSDVHYSSNLRLPTSLSMSKGLTVLLEGKAKECIAIALSPQPSFIMGKTYVIHFGASNNISTVIRRRLPNEIDAIDVNIPCRVCTLSRWIKYWITIVNGQIYVGIGNTPGTNIIGKLDDSLYNQLKSPIDTVRFVGLSNSSVGRKNTSPLKIKNVIVTTCPEFLAEKLKTAVTTNANLSYVSIDNDSSNSNEMNDDADETNQLLKEYQEECRKQQARATKFGIPYKQPTHESFLTWSQAKRIQRSKDKKGFATGFDVTSEAEITKQQKRKERFEKDRQKQLQEQNENEDENNDTTMNDDNNDEQPQEEEVAKEPLPSIQAWDNESLVRQHRTDPPKTLWIQPPPQPGEGGGDGGEDTTDENNMNSDDGASSSLHVLEKIHLFSIDWAAFKQIRTDDIMSYFKDYGPSYIEWLGELSCNVLFEDQYSAKRAMNNMSQSITSPPPSSVLEEQEQALLQKQKQQQQQQQQNGGQSNGQGDEDMAEDGGGGGEGVVEGEQVMMNDDSNNDVKDVDKEDGAKDNDDTMKEAEQGDEEGRDKEKDNTTAKEILPPSDLGNMGWRFCLHPIRKNKNDQYGRRGTTSRLLMRIATTNDTLIERPKHWPKPPPGFTTKRVLGPGMDFDTAHQHQRKKRRKMHNNDYYNDSYSRHRKGGSYDDDNDNKNNGFFGGSTDEEPTALDGSLQSSRDGFSLEQIEAERAAKREQQQQQHQGAQE